MPANIVIPTDSLLASPGPLLIINGRTPKIVEVDVINIGLSLMLADSITAVFMFFPSVLNWFANSTINIPFFVANPIRIITVSYTHLTLPTMELV